MAKTLKTVYDLTTLDCFGSRSFLVTILHVLQVLTVRSIILLALVRAKYPYIRFTDGYYDYEFRPRCTLSFELSTFSRHIAVIASSKTSLIWSWPVTGVESLTCFRSSHLRLHQLRRCYAKSLSHILDFGVFLRPHLLGGQKASASSPSTKSIHLTSQWKLKLLQNTLCLCCREIRECAFFCGGLWERVWSTVVLGVISFSGWVSGDMWIRQFAVWILATANWPMWSTATHSIYSCPFATIYIHRWRCLQWRGVLHQRR